MVCFLRFMRGYVVGELLMLYSEVLDRAMFRAFNLIIILYDVMTRYLNLHVVNLKEIQDLFVTVALLSYYTLLIF